MSGYKLNKLNDYYYDVKDSKDKQIFLINIVKCTIIIYDFYNHYELPHKRHEFSRSLQGHFVDTINNKQLNELLRTLGIKFKQNLLKS